MPKREPKMKLTWRRVWYAGHPHDGPRVGRWDSFLGVLWIRPEGAVRRLASDSETEWSPERAGLTLEGVGQSISFTGDAVMAWVIGWEPGVRWGEFTPPKVYKLPRVLGEWKARSESRLLEKARDQLAKWELDHNCFDGAAVLEVIPVPRAMGLFSS